VYFRRIRSVSYLQYLVALDCSRSWNKAQASIRALRTQSEQPSSSPYILQYFIGRIALLDTRTVAGCRLLEKYFSKTIFCFRCDCFRRFAEPGWHDSNNSSRYISCVCIYNLNDTGHTSIVMQNMPQPWPFLSHWNLDQTHYHRCWTSELYSSTLLTDQHLS